MNASTRKLVAALAVMTATSAVAQAGAPGTDGSGRSIFNPSGDRPVWERERSSLAEGQQARTWRDLFSIKDMNFAFYDPQSAGVFVRRRKDGTQEATVRIESASGAAKRDLMVRAQCGEGLFYFGPISTDAVPLKPVDKGTVGERLFQQLCS